MQRFVDRSSPQGRGRRGARGGGGHGQFDDRNQAGRRLKAPGFGGANLEKGATRKGVPAMDVKLSERSTKTLTGWRCFVAWISQKRGEKIRAAAAVRIGERERYFLSFFLKKNLIGRWVL